MTPAGAVQPSGTRTATAPPAPTPAAPTVKVTVAVTSSHPGADAGSAAAVPSPLREPNDSAERSTTNVLPAVPVKPVGSSTSAVAA